MGFLLRNWHLKLSAVLLATVLYTGIVFSGAFDEATILRVADAYERAAGFAELRPPTAHD